MSDLEFFKKQAKLLFKDWQTQIKKVEDDGFVNFEYHPKFYDVADLFFYYEFSDEDEQDIKLARAQHLIAQMVGFKKWNDLIAASEKELELAKILLKRFKNSSAIQDWEETLVYSGVAEYGIDAVLEYAKQYYHLGDSEAIADLPVDKVMVLNGKSRDEELNKFDDEHNPAGILRTDSSVFCTCCRKAFDFTESKVIRDNEKNLTMVVCKNYPNCRGTYLDYRVLTPTILYGDAKKIELEKGMKAFPDLKMDAKVHCIHCGKEFLYNESNVVVSPDDVEPYVMCKNYPECDGSLIDMMLVEKREER